MSLRFEKYHALGNDYLIYAWIGSISLSDEFIEEIKSLDSSLRFYAISVF